jgi:hypothetical protein
LLVDPADNDRQSLQPAEAVTRVFFVVLRRVGPEWDPSLGWKSSPAGSSTPRSWTGW